MRAGFYAYGAGKFGTRMSDGPSSGSGSGAGSKPSRTGRPKTPGDWARYFRLLIEPVLSTVDARVAFDHAISRPMSLEAPLIAHAAAVSLAEDFRIPPRAIEDPNRTPDVYLWWSLIDDRLDPLRVIDVRAEGALVAPDVCTTIEVWTEIELAALHALSRQARRLRRDDLDRRLHRAPGRRMRSFSKDRRRGRISRKRS